MKEKIQIFKSISAVTIFAGLRSMFSILIPVLLAYLFGTKRDADAYFLASSIQLFIIGVITGVLGIVILPILRDFVVRKEEDNFWKLAGTILTYLVPLLIIFAVALYLFSPTIISSFAASFSPSSKEVVVSLLRILSFSVFAIGILNYLIIIHYSRESFFIPSFNSIIQPLSIVLFMIIFRKLGIKSLAYGFVFGSFVQLILLLPYFIKHAILKFRSEFKENAIIKIIWQRAIVVMFTVFIFGLILPIEKLLASNLPEGSVSYLGYAERIFCILAFLPSMALPLVLLPQLAGHFTSVDINKLRSKFSTGIRNALVITLPLIVTLFVLREPIVYLFLQRGAFDARATLSIAAVLACYLGVFFESERLLILYTLYSMRDVVTPLLTGAISLVFFMLVAMPLSKAMYSSGLALAHSATVLFYIVINLFVLKKKLKHIDIKNIISSASKIALASFCAGAIMWLIYKILNEHIFISSFSFGFLKLFITVLSGVFLYLWLCHIMKLNEITQFYQVMAVIKQQFLFKLNVIRKRVIKNVN